MKPRIISWIIGGMLIVVSFAGRAIGADTFFDSGSAKRVLVMEPRPDYPVEARIMHMEGSGVYRVFLNSAGGVKAMRVETSTGHKILDIAAIKAVIHWRFAPGLPDNGLVRVQFKGAGTALGPHTH